MPNFARDTRDTLKWGSYDGRETLIKDLDVRHLVNILNHIKSANEFAPDSYSDNICQLLEAEAEIRIMAGWAANIGIPRKTKDGTWQLINQTETEKAREDALTQLHKQGLKKALELNEQQS